MMTTTACPCAAQSLRAQSAMPVRAPCTSLILAEAARQAREEGRTARRAAWFALFDRRPFDLICTQAIPGIVFHGTVPLVYTLPQS